MSNIPKRAADLLNRGFFIFPTVRNRKNFFAGIRWSREATRDRNAVRLWARKFPECNWGIATGPSGLLVLDVDGPKGFESLSLLPDLPETLEVTTPHGKHYYYYGNGKSGVDVAPWPDSHLDVRSRGGMVFAFGNVIEGKTYVLNAPRPIVPAPQWLLDLSPALPEAPEDSEHPAEIDASEADIDAAKRYLLSAPVALQGSGGDATTYQVACRLRDYGVDQTTALDLMARSWNCRCEPPWELSDLASKVANAYKYSQNQKGCSSSTGEFEAFGLTQYHEKKTSIEEINEEFCAVHDGSNFVIYRESINPETKLPEWRTMTAAAFRSMMTRIVELNNKIVSLANIWLSSKNRRTADWVVFDPSKPCGYSVLDKYSTAYGRKEGMLNLWYGWTCEPKRGDWSIIRDDLIYRLICSGDEESYNYVLNWIARLVQRPEVPGETAIVLRGEKGVGKSTLGVLLYELCKRHAVIVTSTDGLTGQFSGHLQNKIFLFADEAYWAGDKKGEGKLKSLITGAEVPIRAMQKDSIMRHNRLHILMASNSDWVVPASTDDERRYAVFDVASDRREDMRFWAKLYDTAHAGGLSAMLYELKMRDIAGFVPSHVPKTRALADQKERSFGIEGEWWLEILVEGNLPPGYILSPNKDWRSGPITVDKDLLHQSYCDFAKSHTQPRYLNTKAKLFVSTLSKLGASNCQVSDGDHRGKRGWGLLQLSAARSRWEAAIGAKVWS